MGRNIILYWVIFTTLIMAFCSCNNLPIDVKMVLKLAGDNQEELKKVINHYQAPHDSLKLKAAYFLIKNMKNKYSLEGDKLENYNIIFDQISRIENKNPFDNSNKVSEADSLWGLILKNEGPLRLGELELRPDLQFITSEYLIDNIDYAFKAWQFPWSKHLSFDEFCEYILPYRFRDEVLTYWRSYVLNNYMPLLDSLMHITDPLILCDSINKRLTKKWKYSHVLSQYSVAMTIKNMTKGNMGNCLHQAGLGVFTMRALGIPVAHEQVPHYGNRSLGHDFNSIMCKDGKFLDFEVGNVKIGEVVDTRKKWNFLIPKIYRQNFSVNEFSLAKTKQFNERIIPYFSNPHIFDVTKEYLSVKDVKVELYDSIPQDIGHIYLCVFDNHSWKAVAWAKVDGRLALFQDMGKGIVYLPMYLGRKGLTAASNPIILDNKGNIIPIFPRKKYQQMILKRKYPPANLLMDMMKGGRFQGANKNDFSDVTDIFEIPDSIGALVPKKATIANSRKFRYVRYLFPPNSTGNLAEMHFISKKGKTFQGNLISSHNISNNILKKAVDKNHLTYLDTKLIVPSQWIGLDLGFPKEISKIIFCPRTDKNDVWKNLNYELFYWEEEWKSLGVKKADTYELVYETNVADALYLLRCLDEGKEERVFTYINGQQIWW